MSPLKAEVLLHWAGVILYSASAVAYSLDLFFGREKAQRWGAVLATAGLLPHGAGLILRWVESGHGPYMARYEILSSNAWVAVILFLFAAWKLPRLRSSGAVVMPVCFLGMTAGLFTDPGLRTLPPSLRSVWLVLHVLFAKFGAGGILLSFGAGALLLLREHRPQASFASRLPSSEVLDDYSRRFAGFGFLFWSVMIAAGAIWANDSWGRYWAWDPIEVWSLVTWLSFGAYLHLRRFHGWRGPRAAWLSAACFALSMATLSIVPILTKSLHGEYFQ